MSFVEIDGLVKRFGEEVAVAGIDLAIEEGEFVTLLGPSGCGKTTTLRCIAGLERPDAGEIRIDGVPITSAEKDIFLNPEERNLGMVFQSYAVWPHIRLIEAREAGRAVMGLAEAALTSMVMMSKAESSRALER